MVSRVLKDRMMHWRMYGRVMKVFIWYDCLLFVLDAYPCSHIIGLNAISDSSNLCATVHQPAVKKMPSALRTHY